MSLFFIWKMHEVVLVVLVLVLAHLLCIISLHLDRPHPSGISHILPRSTSLPSHMKD